MKKFVSILTVFAMVAACSTSAFAAGGSQTAPTTVEEIVDNSLNQGDGNGAPSETTPTNTTTEDNNGGTDNNNGGTNNTTTGGNNNTTTTGGNNNNNTTGGNTNNNTTTDNNTQGEKGEPTADPANYPEGSAARKLAEALTSEGKLEFANAEEQVKFFADLLGVDLAELPQNFTIVTNALKLDTAVGVKVEKTKDGLKVTVGQNELTKNHKPEELVALVAPAKDGEKGQVCAIKDDGNGNLTFDTKIEDGDFIIALKTDVEAATPAA
jgi:hypothetical protein